MALELYLAMTESEIREKSAPLTRIAWLTEGFHRETGELEGISALCPEGAMLTVTDGGGLDGVEPDAAIQTLLKAVEDYQCESILLDFQRPGSQAAAELTKKIVSAVTCPVGVSEAYAVEGGAVFLPPVPVDIPVEEYLSPWQGREIWLELSLEGKCATVGESEVSWQPLCEPVSPPHEEEVLCCHYSLKTGEHEAVFTLSRTGEDMKKLMARAEAFGVTRAVGLFQELGDRLK